MDGSEERMPVSGRVPSRPHSTPLSLKWLEENYEFAEGVCIPRSTLYMHYLDFCEKNDCQPVNAASFGKIIRQKFPQVTTRRLGTRGQSKYHYYGIGVKEVSIYYDIVFSRKGIQNGYDCKRESLKQSVAYSPRSKLGTLLPEFPSLEEMDIPKDMPHDKIFTFVMMYRTHCQRILDTVIRANFDEVRENFLLHFWQGMPQHIVPFLGHAVVVRLVGVCDSILYKAITGVLMPSVLQALPESLTQVIRKFAQHIDEWLRVALDGLPAELQKIKFELARRFAQTLRRQTSLNHLCQASRSVVQSGEITAQMLEDWHSVDLVSICKQTLYTMESHTDAHHRLIVKLHGEFERLLTDKAPLEQYTEWLDAMVTRCVVRGAGGAGERRRRARQFLLMWSCFGTRVIRDVTLHSSPSFGSFHLLHLTLDDYVLYLVESMQTAERAQALGALLRGDVTAQDEAPELVLPDPNFTFTSTHAHEGDYSNQSATSDPREAFSDPQAECSSSPRSAPSHSSQPHSPGEGAMMTSYGGPHVAQETPSSHSEYYGRQGEEGPAYYPCGPPPPGAYNYSPAYDSRAHSLQSFGDYPRDVYDVSVSAWDQRPGAGLYPPYPDSYYYPGQAHNNNMGAGAAARKRKHDDGRRGFGSHGYLYPATPGGYIKA